MDYAFAIRLANALSGSNGFATGDFILGNHLLNSVTCVLVLASLIFPNASIFGALLHSLDSKAIQFWRISLFRRFSFDNRLLGVDWFRAFLVLPQAIQLDVLLA